jgi:hypothetical protein
LYASYSSRFWARTAVLKNPRREPIHLENGDVSAEGLWYRSSGADSLLPADLAATIRYSETLWEEATLEEFPPLVRPTLRPVDSEWSRLPVQYPDLEE